MKTRSVNIVQLAAIVMLFISSWTHVSAGVFEGYPDIIICEGGKGKQARDELIFYLEARDKSSTVFYRSSYHLMSLKVGKDGVVRADTESVNDCLNKSLEELREQGRTFDFSKQ